MYISKQKQEEIEENMTLKKTKICMIWLIIPLITIAIANFMHGYFYSELIGNFESLKYEIKITLILFTILFTYIGIAVGIYSLYNKKIRKMDNYDYEMYTYVLDKLYRKDKISYTKMMKKAEVLKKCNQRFLKCKNKGYKEYLEILKNERWKR